MAGSCSSCYYLLSSSLLLLLVVVLAMSPGFVVVVTNGFSAAATATTTTVIHQSPKPIWFSPSASRKTTTTTTITSEQQQQQEETNNSTCIVFLHGRLEADESKGNEPAFPPPEVLYSEFCSSLATQQNQDVLLVDYHEGLATHIGQEPRTSWKLGPISQSILQCINQELVHNRPQQQQQQIDNIILITFSMGTAMGLKILYHHQNNNLLLPQPQIHIRKVIFIEPVWRCWLSSLSLVEELQQQNNHKLEFPTLVVWGTNDQDTLTDSGKSPKGALLSLFSASSRSSSNNNPPILETFQLQGGNHWYILNDDVEYASMGLSPKTTTKSTATQGSSSSNNNNGVMKSTKELKQELIERIVEFCKN